MQQVDEQFYQVFFGTKETVDSFLTNGPWNFENLLVTVRPRFEGSNPMDRCLTKEFFWIIFIGFPRYCYTMEVEINVISEVRQL